MNETRTREWSERDIATLRSMAENGASAPVIARELGRTEGAVDVRARKLGVRFRSRRRQASDGWPTMRGDDEERDRLYVRALCRVLLSLKRTGRESPSTTSRKRKAA